MRTNMAVIFRTSQSLLNGGRLEVLSPNVYKLSCRESDGFRALSIGKHRMQICDDSGVGLRLTLNDTMTPGDYAFMCGVTNPAYTPADNLFSILLLDTSDRVVDARMHFPGQFIVQGLYVRPPLLQFTSSQPLARAEVHLSLRVSEALDPYAVMGAVRAIQIAVPPPLKLITQVPVGNLDGLSTPEVRWFHFYVAERLVRIDIVASAAAVPRAIPEGIYRISFAVQLPEFWMPSVNVWTLSLCRDLFCVDSIAVLPAAGFDFGDPPSIAASSAPAAAAAEAVGAPPPAPPTNRADRLSIPSIPFVPIAAIALCCCWGV